MAKVRLGVLLTLLLLSLCAFRERERVQVWLWHEPMLSERMVGTPTPELPPLAALDGRAVQLSALRGRVVLLHFWTFG